MLVTPLRLALDDGGAIGMATIFLSDPARDVETDARPLQLLCFEIRAFGVDGSNDNVPVDTVNIGNLIGDGGGFPFADVIDLNFTTTVFQSSNPTSRRRESASLMLLSSSNSASVTGSGILVTS